MSTKTSSTKERYRKIRKLRWFILPFSGLAANSYAKVWSTKEIYGGALRQGCVPFLNCHACPMAVSSCPIGILQFHAAIKSWPYMLAGVLGTIGVLVGRAACGWLCPFGWLQDIMYKIKTRKFTIPRSFRYLKYVSLVVLAIALPYFTEGHWFSKLCPWGTIIAGIPWGVWQPINPVYLEPVIPPGSFGFMYWLKIGVLAVFLVLFVFTKRPFCRTFCPLGAIYSLFNRISLLQMKVDQEKCVDCGHCKTVCPVDIQINREPMSAECLRCTECTVCKNVRLTWGFRHVGESKPVAEKAA